MTTPYTTGSVTLTSGSAVVTGVGTAWQTALIAGGTLYVEADGNPLPILTVDSNTQITAAIKWKGATGTYPYAIMRDTAYGQQTVANANALATYLQRLDSASLAALASIAGQMAAGKVPRGLSGNTMEWFTVSDFIKGLLDDADQGSARTTLGAQAALGFTPVQQGGGAGQGTNKIHFGWSGSRIKAQVDFSDQGALWTDGNAGWSLAVNGYHRFPTGLIIQWGRAGSGGSLNVVVGFPVAFNTVAGVLVNHVSAGLPNTTAVASWVGDFNVAGFTATTRVIGNGGSVGGPAGQEISWFAMGF